METLFPNLNKMNKTKMNKKNFLVSFLTVLAVSLFVITAVSAATSELVSVDSVKINGVEEQGNEDVSIMAGEKISVEVIFTALEDASDVRMKATLEGTKLDSESEVFVGDVEDGKRYIKTLTVKVPYELQDEASDNLALGIKVWNGDFKTELDEMTLRVQRTSYNVDVMDVSLPQSVSAGQTIPVDIVVKNTGYNDLQDLYVTAKITALNAEAKAYFGDLVALETGTGDEKEADTVRGRLFLQVPYGAERGVYSLEVEISNNDMTANKVKQFFIENELPGTVIKSGNSLILVNPTNQLKVYSLIPDAGTSVSESVVVVPAGTSKTVVVNPGLTGSAVSVFSGENLVGKVEFTGSESSASSGVVVLTVILAIVFVVLLVALIVLVTKKPEKEEFGESYY